MSYSLAKSKLWGTENIRKRWLECAHISWSVDDPRILHEVILRPGFNQIHNSNGRDWFSHDLVMSVHGFTPCCERLLSKQSGIKAAHSSWGGRYKPCNPDLTHLTHCSGGGPRSLRSFSGGIPGRAFTLSPLPVPVPNKPPRFCGRKAKWSRSSSQCSRRGGHGLCPSTHDLGIAHAKLAVVLHVCFFFRGALRPQKP